MVSILRTETLTRSIPTCRLFLRVRYRYFLFDIPKLSQRVSLARTKSWRGFCGLISDGDRFSFSILSKLFQVKPRGNWKISIPNEFGTWGHTSLSAAFSSFPFSLLFLPHKVATHKEYFWREPNGFQVLKLKKTFFILQGYNKS